MNSFFKLLQVSLGTRDLLSRVPSDAQWEVLLDEGFRQAVTGVLLSGIERLPQEQRPPIDLLLEWIGEVQITEETNKLHLKRTGELSAMVRGVGFDNCVLKGVAVARYYPQPLRRVCGDIDLWVGGRRKDVMKWLRSQYEVSHILWHTVNVDAFEDIAVEVHFHPAWLHNPFWNYRLQRWFRLMAGEKYETEEGYNVMPVEFDAVYSLVHSFRHFLAEGLEMRHVCDYFYILKRIQTENTEIAEIVGTLRRLGMMKYARAMMYVLLNACGMNEDYLLCKPDEKEGRFLLHDIMKGGPRVETESRSFKRYWTMGTHYPSEVLWVYPWRVWHRCWRLCYRD